MRPTLLIPSQHAWCSGGLTLRVVGSSVANSLSSAKTPAAVNVFSSVDLPAPATAAAAGTAGWDTDRCMLLPSACQHMQQGGAPRPTSLYMPQLQPPMLNVHNCLTPSLMIIICSPANTAQCTAVAHAPYLRWCSPLLLPLVWVRPGAWCGVLRGECAPLPAHCNTTRQDRHTQKWRWRWKCCR